MSHLAAMSLVDGVISGEERELLENHRADLGLSREEMDTIFSAIRAGEPAMIPEQADERNEAFLHILELAASDGITAEEKDFLANTANRFGISQQELQTMLDDFDAFGSLD